MKTWLGTANIEVRILQKNDLRQLANNDNEPCGYLALNLS